MSEIARVLALILVVIGIAVVTAPEKVAHTVGAMGHSFSQGISGRPYQ